MTMRKWKNLLFFFLTTFLIPLNVAWAGDVSLDPGYIAGQISFPGFNTTSISLTATGNGYTSTKTTYNSSNYQMTVQGGDWNYNVTASAGLSGPNVPSIGVYFNTRTFPVAPGQTVTNDYAPSSGVVRYQVTITGDPTTTTYGYSSNASKAVASGEKTYTYAYNTTNFGATRTYYWDIPVVANQQISLYATVYVAGPTGGRYYYFDSTAADPYKIPLQDVAPGQTVVVPLNIQFVAPDPYNPPPPPPPPTYNTGTIAGNVSLLGLPAENFLRHTAITNIATNPGNYAYPITFTGSAYSSYVYPYTYFDSSIDSGLRWPYKEGNRLNNRYYVYPDQTTTLDFERQGALLTGAINISGTVTNEDMRYYTLALNGQDQVWENNRWVLRDTNYGSASFRRDAYGSSYKRPSVRQYKLFLATGNWDLAQMSFRKDFGSNRYTALNITDYSLHYDGRTYFGTPVQVNPDTINQKDFNYCFGSAIFRFRSVNGSLLSSPSISGSGQHQINNLQDLYMSVSASSSVSRVQAPELEIFGPNGDYTLTTMRVIAEDGTTVEFPDITVSLTCNTTKIFDIPGPTLVVTAPQPENVTYVLSTPVTGRAFSGSTIQSITVNGQAVTFTPVPGSTTNEVTFTSELPLADGKNTITVTAIDVTGAQATDQLIVFADRWNPTVSITTPVGGSRFLNTLTDIPLAVEAADQGYGYTLEVSMDGTVIHTATGAANDTTPVAISYNGTIGPLSVGDHVISATVTDRAGNSATSSVTITSYADQWPPVASIISPADGSYFGNVQIPLQTSASDQGSGFTMSVILDGTRIHQATGAADIAQPVTISYNQTLDPLAGGDHTIAVNAADTANQTASVSHTIHVDPWIPVVTIAKPDQAEYAAPGSIPLQVQAADQGYGFNVKVYLDNVLIHEATGGLDLTAPISVTFAQTKEVALGTHVLKAVAVDLAGNTDTKEYTFTFVDNVAPVLNGLVNQVVEATSISGAAAAFTVTATDNYDPAPVVSCSAVSGSIFALGDTTITCTARDAGGNSSNGSFLITVRDTTPPALTVPANITVILKTAITDAAVQAFLNGATATDLVDASVTITNTLPDLSTIGAKQVTFTAVDDFGNTTTGTATINVVYGCGDIFLPPVSLDRPFKIGSTIPVKLRLCDAAGLNVVTPSAMIFLQQYSGQEPVGEPIEVTSTSNADTGNYFRVLDNMHIYNLYTRDLSSGTYQIRAVLDDGTTRTTPLLMKQ